ncbi:alpha/beta hydrolase [Tistrella bauzanensis]|uniref:alpha/beta hydrolase n=1 Tax=Tistrella TaxID=171436 RepID=UPI0031F607B0
MPLSQTTITLAADDGHDILIRRWHDDTRAPRGIVQIAHGMGEHAGRYARLAAHLVAEGHVVYASEHRGHGPAAAAAGTLGDFGPRGFAALVDDLAVVSRHLRALHPGLKLVLVGHSMGSFAAQSYLVDHGDLADGVALSGTTAVEMLGSAAMAGSFRLEDLNDGLPDVRTPFDWLSRDPAEVDAYIADPLCGFTVTDASFGSIFTVCGPLADPAAGAGLRKDMPLLLFTGSRDPVNNNLAWFGPLVDRYRQAGLTDVSSHVFGGARHETLNETNRDEVMAVLAAWIGRVV